MDCNLCLQVWRVVKECLGISIDSGAKNLENSFSNWFQNDVSYNLLRIFISWSIWLTRNQAIFLETKPIALICGIRGINLFKDYETINNRKFKKNCPLVDVSSAVVGYFDGASNLNHCGCGMVLVLNKDHFFNLCMGGSLGSNTKAELLSLFGLLHFASLIVISDISVYGDSKVLIDWLNGSTNLHVLLLKHWIHKVQDIKRTFEHISFRHISRCFNTSADALSKTTISLKFGFVRFQEFLDGSFIHEGETNLLELM